MAIMVEAGPPAAMSRSAGDPRRLEIRKISVADLIECIEKGVKDFTRSSKYGMFFGAFYAVGGALIVWLAFYTGYWYLAYPLIMGFALLAPFGAAGTYEISRRLEAGQPLSWGAVVGAVWSRTGQDLGWLALVSLFTFMIWIDIALFIYLMFYGNGLSSVAEIFANVFTTTYGLTFLLVGNGVGAIIAFCVFSFTAVVAASGGRPRCRRRNGADDQRPCGRGQSADHARLDGGDRNGPRRVVRHLSCRAAGALPDPRTHHLAPLPQADCLTTCAGPALRSSCAA